MKTINNYLPAIAVMLIMLAFSQNASARFHRHDHSVYSCNEINADRSFEKNKSKRAKFAAEYKKYCTQKTITLKKGAIK
jgi:hypothetical protein